MRQYQRIELNSVTESNTLKIFNFSLLWVYKKSVKGISVHVSV